MGASVIYNLSPCSVCTLFLFCLSGYIQVGWYFVLVFASSLNHHMGVCCPQLRLCSEQVRVGYIITIFQL